MPGIFHFSSENMENWGTHSFGRSQLTHKGVCQNIVPVHRRVRGGVNNIRNYSAPIQDLFLSYPQGAGMTAPEFAVEPCLNPTSIDSDEACLAPYTLLEQGCPK
jgi:hypothetical protein